MLRKLFFLLLLFPAVLQAQRTISWKGRQLNALDRQGRKQGDWLFFGRNGQVRMQCRFENDQPAGALTYYTDSGDTALLRFPSEAGREPFIYYYKGAPINGVFAYRDESCQIELDHIPDGFSQEDLRQLKEWYALKLEPVYMFGLQALRDYFSAAYYKSNTIPNWNHNFVLTINASGKVTNVEWAEEGQGISSAGSEREIFEMFYSMGRWQPFFDTWNTKEIKLTMSLGADLQPITAR